MKVQWLAELRRASLRRFENIEALAKQYQSNAEVMEGLLQALFLLAVDDLYPNELARFDRVKWLNVQRLTLEPAEWDTCGLFEPRSKPREFRYLYEEIRAQLKCKQSRSAYEIASGPSDVKCS